MLPTACAGGWPGQGDRAWDTALHSNGLRRASLGPPAPHTSALNWEKPSWGAKCPLMRLVLARQGTRSDTVGPGLWQCCRECAQHYPLRATWSSCSQSPGGQAVGQLPLGNSSTRGSCSYFRPRPQTGQRHPKLTHSGTQCQLTEPRAPSGGDGGLLTQLGCNLLGHLPSSG